MEEVVGQNGSIQELFLVKVKHAVGIIERDAHKELCGREGESVVRESAGIAMRAWLKSSTLEVCCKIVQVLHPNAMKK